MDDITKLKTQEERDEWFKKREKMRYKLYENPDRDEPIHNGIEEIKEEFDKGVIEIMGQASYNQQKKDSNKIINFLLDDLSSYMYKKIDKLDLKYTQRYELVRMISKRIESSKDNIIQKWV